MQVKLIQHTPNPEVTIAAAARLCYAPISAAEIVEKMSPKQVERMLRMLFASGHLSAFEHASFSFAVDGISRVTSHQLVRHRLASYNQQSQRYVSYTSPEYVVPPSVEKHPELKDEFERAIKGYFESYRRLQEAGIPAEDARYLLPNAITTRLVVTMNVRELMHSCSIRLCTRAQWEIRELFHRMRDEVRQVAPLLGSFLMIKCELLGYCDEHECCWIRPPKEEVLGQSPGPNTKQS